MSEPKPAEAREWTLRLDTLIINDLTEGQQKEMSEVGRPVIRVIEYSAYAKLEAENARLRAALGEIRYARCSWQLSQRIASEALK